MSKLSDPAAAERNAESRPAASIVVVDVVVVVVFAPARLLFTSAAVIVMSFRAVTVPPTFVRSPDRFAVRLRPAAVDAPLLS
ncbi:hypothetical protein LMG27174_07318 [Paraburkholderia rhynchosiae]|uniref:Uncharacterized protein n=1 Tax=Paraburkholderia rhynchosiae TaxID=487049 RepID=A0A6J5CYA1_9BURK|nr:hypothetical protein LMG27174_07318 [Paraburkholderia rhynchosiae]